VSTWNPADKSAAVVLSGGNLTATITASSQDSGGTRGTLAQLTGKLFFEGAWTFSQIGTNPVFWFGLAQLTADLSSPPLVTNTGYGAAVYAHDNGGTLFSSPEAGGIVFAATSFASGDTVGFACDLDAGLGWVAKNGAWIDFGAGDDPGTATGGVAIATGVSFLPVCGLTVTSGTGDMTANFGGSAFAYSTPTGFSAWDAGGVIGQPTVKRLAGVEFAASRVRRRGARVW
jgi:hypothetical protein